MFPAPEIPGEFEQRERARRGSKIFLTFLFSLEAGGAPFRHPVSNRSLSPRGAELAKTPGSWILGSSIVRILKGWKERVGLDELFILLIEVYAEVLKLRAFCVNPSRLNKLFFESIASMYRIIFIIFKKLSKRMERYFFQSFQIFLEFQVFREIPLLHSAHPRVSEAHPTNPSPLAIFILIAKNSLR